MTDHPAAYMTELAETLAAHSPTTLWVTKEALRRARHVPDGDDLVLEAVRQPGLSHQRAALPEARLTGLTPHRGINPACGRAASTTSASTRVTWKRPFGSTSSCSRRSPSTRPTSASPCSGSPSVARSSTSSSATRRAQSHHHFAAHRRGPRAGLPRGGGAGRARPPLLRASTSSSCRATSRRPMCAIPPAICSRSTRPAPHGSRTGCASAIRPLEDIYPQDDVNRRARLFVPDPAAH